MSLGRRIIAAIGYAVFGFALCWLFDFGYVEASVHLNNALHAELPEPNIWVLSTAYLGLPTLLAISALKAKLPGTKGEQIRGFDVLKVE